MARPLALARTEGGMTLSGPKAWRGLTKEVRILPHFLHSAEKRERIKKHQYRSREAAMHTAQGREQRRTAGGEQLTRHRRRERIIDAHREDWFARGPC